MAEAVREGSLEQRLLHLLLNNNSKEAQGQMTSSCAKSVQSCLTLSNPVGCTCQAPLTMGFSRQEHWTGLPGPPPGDLPGPGVQPTSLSPPARRAGPLPPVRLGSPPDVLDAN